MKQVLYMCVSRYILKKIDNGLNSSTFLFGYVHDLNISTLKMRPLQTYAHLAKSARDSFS